MLGIVAVIAILFIVNFSVVVSGLQAILNSIKGLLYGAMLAFILNLVMDPVEKRLKKSKRKFLVNHARAIGIFISLLTAILIIALILSIVIPNLISAFTVLTKEAPDYITQIEDLLSKLFEKYPSLQESVKDIQINWSDVAQSLIGFLTKGTSAASDAKSTISSTLNIFTSIVGGAVNTFVIVIFAIYVLSEKERFIRLYYFFTDMYLKPAARTRLTRNLRICNQSFKAFVGGEIIEAAILSTMCVVGMLILRLPYATMIGILVGVINMIPFVGAFIGGGIGAFIIFTISPIKCIIFLIFLVVIQQIESNVFFPRVIGSRVGLPGIYVMITIVIGGSLFGVLGMVLGVPLVASLYKIAQIYFKDKARAMKNSCKKEDKVKYQKPNSQGTSA